MGFSIESNKVVGFSMESKQVVGFSITSKQVVGFSTFEETQKVEKNISQQKRNGRQPSKVPKVKFLHVKQEMGLHLNHHLRPIQICSPDKDIGWMK